MKTILKIVVFASVILLLQSCCSSCRKGSPVIGNLESTSWILIEFENEMIEDSGITLIFNASKKMIEGKGTCNKFFAGYSLYDTKRENNIKISNVGSSYKYCPDADIETRFVARLSEVVEVLIDGVHLLMMDKNREIIAVCESNPIVLQVNK